MPITHSGIGNAPSDSLVIAVGTQRQNQAVMSDTTISVTAAQTKLSEAKVVLQNTGTAGSDATIRVSGNEVTISSFCKITVNPVDLVLVKQSAPSIEVGTATNPLEFTAALAGQTTLHPDNPFLLYNDRTGSADSVDAKNISMEVVEMSIVDELVGYSNGLASQTFSVAFPSIIKDDANNTVNVKVGITNWTEVTSFTGYGNLDKVFVVDYTLGAIIFGNNVNGMIPTNSDAIFVTYTPDTATFGVEATEDGWLGVQSTDTDSNDRTLLLNVSSVIDLTHVQAGHVPLISTGAVQGVYLITDPNRLGINYFTGGTYNDVTGSIALGTALPFGTTQVYLDFKYKIADDAELAFTQLSKNLPHAFDNPIPSLNAKKLNFQLVIPVGVSPTNGVKVKLRLRVYYTEY